MGRSACSAWEACASRAGRCVSFHRLCELKLTSASHSDLCTTRRASRSSRMRYCMLRSLSTRGVDQRPQTMCAPPLHRFLPVS
jgi:hypothetical protein